MGSDKTFDQDDLNWIGNSLRENSIIMTYTGDLSDCGNEIGIIVGERYKNMSEDETSDFISGIKHGISLTNGTH
jgi:2-keto-4-pentenoate hydratase/2-oxohepta-3-ene-1,7-dioic acid hydratase in catechol pathway